MKNDPADFRPVSKKSGDQWSPRLQRLRIDRGRPGRGFVHLLGANTLLPFIDLLPDREEITEGLEMIMLVPKVEDVFGLAHPGVIEICAWPRDLWLDLDIPTYEQHRWLLEMLEVPCTVEEKENSAVCEFTEKTARAHQLLGTFLHELGHHRHLLKNRPRGRAARRPAPYTGTYGRDMAKRLFNAYADSFGI